MKPELKDRLLFPMCLKKFQKLKRISSITACWTKLLLAIPITKDFAVNLIVNEQLGKDDITDVLDHLFYCT